jgi:hypothetical protein
LSAARCTHDPFAHDHRYARAPVKSEHASKLACRKSLSDLPAAITEPPGSPADAAGRLWSLTRSKEAADAQTCPA